MRWQLGLLASFVMDEGSDPTLFRQKNLSMSHGLMTYHAGPCISPVPTFHGSSPLPQSSQITMCNLLGHISSETEWNGKSSLRCFKNCLDVSLDDVHFAKNPISCWSRLPRSVGVTVKPRGVLSLLRTVVVSVIMAMEKVTALAAGAGAVSEGGSFSCSWLVVCTLFTVAALVIATKVDFDLYLLHISLALTISGGDIRFWALPGSVLRCEVKSCRFSITPIRFSDNHPDPAPIFNRDHSNFNGCQFDLQKDEKCCLQAVESPGIAARLVPHSI